MGTRRQNITPRVLQAVHLVSALNLHSRYLSSPAIDFLLRPFSTCQGPLRKCLDHQDKRAVPSMHQWLPSLSRAVAVGAGGYLQGFLNRAAMRGPHLSRLLIVWWESGCSGAKRFRAGQKRMLLASDFIHGIGAKNLSENACVSFRTERGEERNLEKSGYYDEQDFSLSLEMTVLGQAPGLAACSEGCLILYRENENQ